MMNPHGKVLDIHGIQALGEEVNIEPMPKNPEKLFDIVRDLNNQRGRGNKVFTYILTILLYIYIYITPIRLNSIFFT